MQESVAIIVITTDKNIGYTITCKLNHLYMNEVLIQNGIKRFVKRYHCLLWFVQ